MAKPMTVQQALKKLVTLDKYYEESKNDARLRVYAGRIRKGDFQDGAAARLLESFGFKVMVIETGKKAASKGKAA